jgi:hypothetical protein
MEVKKSLSINVKTFDDGKFYIIEQFTIQNGMRFREYIKSIISTCYDDQTNSSSIEKSDLNIISEI